MDEFIQARMLKTVTKLCALAVSTLLSVATLADSPSTVWIDHSYRQDSNNWSIAEIGGTPNILSDLIWEDLEIFQLRGRFDMFWQNSLYLRGTLGYGWILSGHNQDSDYDSDNRQDEFSRSINDAGDGNTSDALIGIGKPFRLGAGSRKTLIIPMIGFSHHEQQLKMQNGLQVVADLTLYPTWPPVGTRFPDLNNSYTMQWYGAWFGVDMQMQPTERTQILIQLEYHKINYYGEGNWNLRDDWQHPRSFSDWADGNGRVARFGWNITFKKDWKLGVELDYQRWTTSNGLRRVYLANPTGTAETGFNGANWESKAIMLTVGCDCLNL